MKKILTLVLTTLLLLSVAAVASAATSTETGTGVTVVKADDWAATYADVYASYMKNAENEAIIDHVEEYPMIATVYEGMAFNKYYGSARGHYYTVQDVTSTGRPHALANCFTCKTPDFTAKVNNEGVNAYTIPFADMLAQVNESVSCYNCHANTPGELVVTHTYLADAMGDDFAALNPETAACAQCHVEYYFAPETKAVTLPYSNMETMHPDSILAFFEETNFADYTNPRTGVKQIKVQHPEFETYMGKGSVHAAQFSCADCHMEKATNEAGETIEVDEMLDERYGAYFPNGSSDDYEPYTLGENEYFVVGDNRYNSHDSRDWNDAQPNRDVGPITDDMIVGRVRSVIWPLSSIRTVK